MKMLTAFVLLCAASGVMAQSYYRQGYIRKDGTYVAPSYATNPNDTKMDNYSTKGNYNPYTGKAGTVDPYKQTSRQTGSLYYEAEDQKRQRYGN